MNRTLALSMTMLLSGCVLAPPMYWADEIHGRVVDAATQEPIEGAVVVANWRLYSGGAGHGGHRNSLKIDETLTDANGEYTLRKWGPKLRPVLEILDDAPRIVIVKTGYDCKYLWNEDDSNGFFRRSEWDGKTVEIRKTELSVDRRLTELNMLLLISPPPPMMLREILKEEPLHHPWPGDGALLFIHVKKLLERSRHD